VSLLPFARSGRRGLIPEVVQTSAMDCGPAALKCLLEGFYISASYGRLREACQTSVDGTSVDVIESVARQLGLDAEQIMLPPDNLWLPEARALPAIVVVQRSSFTHFVIVWRRLGRWLQIMDPGVGRRWTTCERFTREIFRHSFRVTAVDWRDWAVSRSSLAILASRLRSLRARRAAADDLINRAKNAESWRPMAALDAAARMLASLASAGALRRGASTLRLLETLLARTAEEKPGECLAIPASYWSVGPAESADQVDYLMLHGAILVRVSGRLSPADTAQAGEALAPELAAALSEPPQRPLRELWTMVRADGVLMPLALMGALGLAVGALIVEALLFRGLFELASDLNLVSQRAIAFGALVSFVALLWAFELPIVGESLRLGRRLETRLRLQLMQKLPKLSDRYFQSRPVSDMAERSHSIYLLRSLPDLVLRFAQSGWELVFTLLGIGLIAPPSLPAAFGIAALAIGFSIAGQGPVSERDLRVRGHAGALHVFYLDALLGIAPIRTHSAEPSVRREHEALLVDWARAAKSLIGVSVVVAAAQSAVCLGLAGWLLLTHVQTFGVTPDLLLLVYWVLKLPALGERLAALTLQYPAQRNIAGRLLEPLKALEEAPAAIEDGVTAPQPATAQAEASIAIRRPGIAIDMQDVSVVAAGHTILRDIHLAVGPGEHIAVVGPSGAGKSSLLGLLLGWHQAGGGRVLVDGEPLRGDRLLQLRAETAWVDPAIQIWNRSLLENLRYNSAAGPHAALEKVLASAELDSVLTRLPDGLQSSLGEAGACLSGGEGQRVRLARAMWQEGVRLVLLDEPFRGLDRAQRQRHLTQARRFWQDATLICVTHDVAETQSFDRVLVVEDGQIVEDAQPERLAATSGSRYRALLDIEASLREGVWGDSLWRRLQLHSGRLQEAPRLFVTAKRVAQHE
jgi:ABC-type bacteriocin/lantibiotic exporter with double-glycine peptidase domain